MANLNGRVERLENRAGGPVAWSFLWQDLNDPDLFTGKDGREYRRGDPDWPENCITVVYEDWREP
jgi:hypothetical protein